jgi:hypothetical protein
MERRQPCCLIAEDQALIGMALEAYLEDVGILVAGPFASCAEALYGQLENRSVAYPALTRSGSGK